MKTVVELHKDGWVTFHSTSGGAKKWTHRYEDTKGCEVCDKQTTERVPDVRDEGNGDGAGPA